MESVQDYNVLMSNILETYRKLRRNSDKLMLLLRYYVTKVMQSGKTQWLRLCNRYILMAALALHLNGIVIAVDNIKWVLEQTGSPFSRSQISSSLKTFAVLKVVRPLKVKKNYRMYAVDPVFEQLLVKGIKL